ncbi:MAG: tRNA pseudouridine(38-40) synthase TruA [Chlamydiia bacterium]|nr:tRNA pseudouridine(38-40) synthase TruA [Chlamydiia bacterium]
MIKRFKAIISYEGAEYCGWQSQGSGDSIQEHVERVISFLRKEEIKIFSAGRTDAGVHAINQVIHFDVNTEYGLNPLDMLGALSFHLPKDIRVMSIEIADREFDARKSALNKTYVYRLSNEVVDPIYRRLTVFIAKEIDIKRSKYFLSIICGKHDFKAFANSNSTGVAKYSSVRTIFNSSIIKTKGCYEVRVNGSGFLYKMVRNIVGTMCYYAQGKITIEEIESAMLTGDRTKLGPTMPAQGLCLESIEY